MSSSSLPWSLILIYFVLSLLHSSCLTWNQPETTTETTTVTTIVTITTYFSWHHRCDLQEKVFLPVTVYIQDVNDHSPEFQNAPYHLEVDEVCFTWLWWMNEARKGVQLTSYDNEHVLTAFDGKDWLFSTQMNCFASLFSHVISLPYSFLISL